jgi:hypothetical protein
MWWDGLPLYPHLVCILYPSPLHVLMETSRRFWDRTVEHRLTITYGPDGTLSYSAKKQNSNLAPLISYYAVGYMGASPSLKVSRIAPCERSGPDASLVAV